MRPGKYKNYYEPEDTSDDSSWDVQNALSHPGSEANTPGTSFNQTLLQSLHFSCAGMNIIEQSLTL
jgi:hypothetical protein